MHCLPILLINHGPVLQSFQPRTVCCSVPQPVLLSHYRTDTLLSHCWTLSFGSPGQVYHYSTYSFFCARLHRTITRSTLYLLRSVALTLPPNRSLRVFSVYVNHTPIQTTVFPSPNGYTHVPVVRSYRTVTTCAPSTRINEQTSDLFPELSWSHSDAVPPNTTASTDCLNHRAHKTRCCLLCI